MSASSTDPAIASGAAGSAEPWQLRLLGAVEAQRGAQRITRWPSRAVAVLLARLALAPDRAHAREELVDLLWPDAPLDVGRNRLRQVLSTLKSLLEPADEPGAAPVIAADRLTIRLRPGAVRCDAVEFQRLLRSGDLAAARAGYRGELMPGYYDEWVLEARSQLAAGHDRTEGLALPAPPAVPAQSLPSHWTRLYGIEHRATRLLTLLRHERLVTLVGPGGCGKTRLAVEVARALGDRPEWMPDGEGTAPRFARIAFVSLIDCLDEQQALDALARTLSVAAREPLQRIHDTLAGHPVLLVLDNFEQLTDCATGLLHSLLERLPQLHLLVTSRQRTGVAGEQVFALGGLPLPDAAAALPDMLRSPAVALFVDRARAVRPDFQPVERDAAALCALARLLDGMPLALELAASRLRGCSPHELLQQLRADTGTPLLDALDRGGGPARARDRHASFREVMRWSWRHLKPSPARLLQAMTVLGAPARVDTVVAVAGLDKPTTLGLLQDLIDASLVQAHEDGRGVMRHGLLQPVREFAAESLPAAQALQARAGLRRWLIEQAPSLLAAGPVAFEPDLDLVYAGIVGAVADGVPQQAAQIAVALKRYWSLDAVESMPVTVMQALDRAAAAGLDGALRSELCELLAHMRGLSGFMREALVLADEALACATDDRQRSLALTRAVWMRMLAGQYQPVHGQQMAEALACARRSGDAAAEALALRMQMMVGVNVHRDFVGSEPHVMHAQRLWESLGDHRNARRRLLDRVTCWAWSGRNEEAAEALVRCEQEAWQDQDIQSALQIAWQLGRVCIRLRRWPEAAAAFRRCLRVAWQRNQLLMQSYALLHVPDALVMMGQAETAARLQGYAVPQWEQLFGTINRIEAAELRRTRRLLRLALGPAAAEALRLSGRGLQRAEAVALALAGD
ncbi:MAG: NACHT domain-containing protein [Rubrivivax sp.]|nr:NACHT domain-containing protein [Rubrivivax sp.]